VLSAVATSAHCGAVCGRVSAGIVVARTRCQAHPTYALLLIVTYCMKLGCSAVDRRRRAWVSRRSRRVVLCVCSCRSVSGTRARCAGIICVVDGDDPRWRRRRSTAGVEREIPRSTCGANATRSTVVSREHDADILRSTRSARGAGAVVIDGVELVDRVGVEAHPHVRIVAVAKYMQRTGGQRDGARSACVVESVVSCVALCCGRG